MLRVNVEQMNDNIFVKNVYDEEEMGSRLRDA